MQPLQNASDPRVCAASVIEAALDVILLMRETTAHGPANNGSATMMHIRAMGTLRKRPGATLSALAAQLALTLSATSRLVDCLVAKGYVARTIPEGNRRTLALHLTPAGVKVHDRARQKAQRALSQLLGGLTTAQRAALTLSAQSLRQVIEDSAAHNTTR